jgi:hypothetical protein
MGEGNCVGDCVDMGVNLGLLVTRLGLLYGVRRSVGV